MNSENKPVPFPALTGIRALAVYLVYLHHTNPFSIEKFGNFIHGLVTEFHIGVSIFFVLSGFLITHRYADQAAWNKTWLKKYMLNRVARVYPMYFIMTTFTLLVFLYQDRPGENFISTYFMNITFLRGFFDHLKFTLVGQGWSLTVEECFYFSAPLLFFLLRRSMWSLWMLPVGLIFLGCLLVSLFHGKTHDGFFESFSFMFIYTFPGRCVEFFWGMGLALLCKEQLTTTRQGVAYTFSGALLTVGLVSIMSLFGTASAPAIYNWPGLCVNNFLLPGAIAVLFYGLIREKSWLQSILNSPPLVLLGKSSYTFYLIHVGIVYQFVVLHIQNYLMVFLLLNAIAVGLWFLVEEPLNASIRKLG